MRPPSPGPHCPVNLYTIYENEEGFATPHANPPPPAAPGTRKAAGGTPQRAFIARTAASVLRT